MIYVLHGVFGLEEDMMIAPMNEKEVSYLMKLFEVATSDCMMTDLGIRPGKARCTDTFVCR